VASPRQERTRQTLVDAGTALFVSYGFRHTSMEGIAAEAGVAKTTAYAHFPNKEVLFAAVVEHVAKQMIARAEAAAAAARGPEAAVLASVTCKQLELYDLLHRSRHARELLEAFDDVSGAQSQRAHDDYAASLIVHLRRCKRVGPKAAAALAVVLDQAAWGLMTRASGPEALREALRLLVQRMLGPAR
jgi:AcrR family transcriptional regulator